MPVITPIGSQGSRRRRRDRGPTAAPPASSAARPPPTPRRRTPRWRDVATTGAADPRDRRPRRGRRARRRPPGRLERLGRRARRRARPASALLANDPHLGIGDAVGLVHERPPLPDGQRGLPVRRRRRVVPGRARRRPRPQRPDRVGRDERRSGRRGPVRRDGRPGGRRQLRLRRGVDPVRGPARDDQGRRRRRTSTSTCGRPATARSSTTSTRASKDAPLLALRWTATAEVDGTFEAIFNLTDGLELRRVQGRVRDLRRAVPELRLRRRRRPHRLRPARPHPDPGRRRGPGRPAAIGQRRQARMGRLHPDRQAADASSIRRAASSRRPTTPRSTPGIRTTSRASGTRAIAPRGSSR